MWYGIDFEFRNLFAPRLEMVCGSMVSSTEKKSAWLMLQADFIIPPDAGLISHNCSSEARSLQALGYDPMKFKWFDTMIAYKMLLARAGEHIIGGSLNNMCEHFGVIHPFADIKKDMQALIVSKSDYTEEEKKNILDYNLADSETTYLCAQHLVTAMTQKYQVSREDIIKSIQYLSLYGAASGVIETNGIPIQMDYLQNLRGNAASAYEHFASSCSYPFYQLNSKGKSSFKHSIFNDYIKSLGISWPVTPKSSEYSTTKETLKEFFYIPHIQSLFDTREVLSAFNSMSDVESTIGPDNRQRIDLSIFGTVTSRNAPRTSLFLPGKPRPFRMLIQPPPGHAITVIDWGQQEILLLAIYSGDENLLEAYNSGDPYVRFGQLAHAIPTDGIYSSEDKKLLPQFKPIRSQYKSTMLGMGYGMGVDKLWVKLMVDVGRIPRSTAAELHSQYHRAFPKIKPWAARMMARAKVAGNFFVTADGWRCEANPERANTMRNWPIQSAGAVLLRMAIIKSVVAGLKVIMSYHDAIYIEHEIGSSDPDKLSAIMDECAVKLIKRTIKQDRKTIPHGTDWIDLDKHVEITKKMIPYIKNKNIPEEDIASELQ